MEKKTVKICWINESWGRHLSLPRYHSEMASGMDVEAALERPYFLKAGEIHLFHTGFRLAILPGYEIQVRPRSGLAAKYGVTVVNSPGTIDADYRGEVRIALINLGKNTFTVNRGDRIAQMVLVPVVQAQLQLHAELDETDRGIGGFGHTGL